MIKIQCDANEGDSIELTSEQIEEVLTFEKGCIDYSWGWAYDNPPYDGCCISIGTAEGQSVWLTRESFEALREHVSEIVEIPRSEVQPGELFSHARHTEPCYKALERSPLLTLGQDRLPCLINDRISWTFASTVCFVRRPKATKPDRLAGLRKVFPDATDFKETSGVVSCRVLTTLALEDLIRLQDEYPGSRITIEADGPQRVGVFVDV